MELNGWASHRCSAAPVPAAITPSADPVQEKVLGIVAAKTGYPEDMLQPDGTFGKPFFKPDWSPDFLLSVNYMCHFLVLRRQLVERVGGFRGGFDLSHPSGCLQSVTLRQPVGFVRRIASGSPPALS